MRNWRNSPFLHGEEISCYLNFKCHWSWILYSPYTPLNGIIGGHYFGLSSCTRPRQPAQIKMESLLPNAIQSNWNFKTDDFFFFFFGYGRFHCTEVSIIRSPSASALLKKKKKVVRGILMLPIRVFNLLFFILVAALQNPLFYDCSMWALTLFCRMEAASLWMINKIFL
jgi:hypothetical protein